MFLTHDPVRQYSNPYAYVGWNPVNRIDPTGMSDFGPDPEPVYTEPEPETIKVTPTAWQPPGMEVYQPGDFVLTTAGKIEIVVWQPVGWGNSSFGHVSVNINETAYSFGERGMYKGPKNEHHQKNAFREVYQ